MELTPAQSPYIEIGQILFLFVFSQVKNPKMHIYLKYFFKNNFLCEKHVLLNLFEK